MLSVFFLFSIIQINADVNQCITDSCSSTYHPIIDELKQYIDNNDDFALQLNMTFMQAGHGPNSLEPITYDDMYNFLNSVLTLSPSTENAMLVPLTFWKFAKTEIGSQLVQNNQVNKWIQKWLNTWSEYLNSPQSTSDLSSWLESMDMTDFIVPDNGYQSFNDFFTRNVKANTRPIHAFDDETIITSPVDGVLDYVLNNISIDTVNGQRFMIKGVEFNVLEMLGNDMEKARKYENGTLLLMSLYFHNYHHYHSYCNDVKIEDIDQFGGYYFCLTDCLAGNNREILHNCSMDNIPACHALWHHVNTRGIVHMKCNGNHVQQQYIYDTALVVVGLGHVSSVNFIVDPSNDDDELILNKGDKLGHFAYGGSTISLLFPPNTIDQVLIQIGEETQMGKPLATLKPHYDYPN